MNGLRFGVEAGFAGGAIANQVHKGCARNSSRENKTIILVLRGCIKKSNVE